jgi:molybdate transport system substrate-binding protein
MRNPGAPDWRHRVREEAVKKMILGAVTVLLLNGSLCVADEIKVLSAGAMQRGLIVVAQKFKARDGHDIKVDYATAPELRKMLMDGTTRADVILAPKPTLAELAGAGKISGESQTEIGGVGAAVLVRNDATAPDISSLDAFKRALLEADAIVHNRASSGIYIESMFKKIGVYRQIESKIVKVADGEAVTARIKAGKGKEFGFGGYTDVLLNQDAGDIKLVGPIPEEVQNYTLYAGAVIATASDQSGARLFLDYLKSPEARGIFQSSGVVPVKK